MTDYALRAAVLGEMSNSKNRLQGASTSANADMRRRGSGIIKGRKPLNGVSQSLNGVATSSTGGESQIAVVAVQRKPIRCGCGYGQHPSY